MRNSPIARCLGAAIEMIKSTVVIVHEDDVVRNSIRAIFEHNGFTVHPVGTVDELMGLLERKPVDLVVLGLGTSDGFSVTRTLRTSSEIGIIHFGGRDDPRQRVAALEVGADEYLVPPVDWREMMARARNLVRRVHRCRPPGPVRRKTFDGWVLHLDERRLSDAAGRDVRLTGAEFELLAVFTSNPGRVLDRDFLLETTTRRKPDPMDRTIDTLVRRLRRILECDPHNPRLLTTVHGQGYVFTGRVA